MGEIVGFYWVDLRIRDSRIENCIKKHPLRGVLKFGGNSSSTFHSSEGYDNPTITHDNLSELI